MRTSLRGYAAAAFIAATAVGALDQTQIQLELNGGLIEGLLVQNDTSPVERYLGVPFAKPPIGDLRWQVSHVFTPPTHAVHNA